MWYKTNIMYVAPSEDHTYCSVFIVLEKVLADNDTTSNYLSNYNCQKMLAARLRVYIPAY